MNASSYPHLDPANWTSQPPQIPPGDQTWQQQQQKYRQRQPDNPYNLPTASEQPYYSPIAPSADESFSRSSSLYTSVPTSGGYSYPQPALEQQQQQPYDGAFPTYSQYPQQQSVQYAPVAVTSSPYPVQAQSGSDGQVKAWPWLAEGAIGGSRTYENRNQDYNAVENEEINVFAYDGGAEGEPYGARGIDGYQPGNRIDYSSTTTQTEEVRGSGEADPGAQRFGVKLLASSMEPSRNIICQVALDGVRLLDPKDGKSLRVYPLHTIYGWKVDEKKVFSFMTRSAVDVSQKEVRLEGSEWTVSNLLDAVTAACVQVSEMVDKESSNSSKRPTESATAAPPAGVPPLFGWIAGLGKGKDEAVAAGTNVQEERDHWIPDEAAPKCAACSSDFHAFNRKHHCRNCGGVFCDKCSKGRTPLTSHPQAQPVRVCDQCLAEVTHRLLIASSSSDSSASPSLLAKTHQQLAQKLNEEMERKAASASMAAKRTPSGSRGGLSTSPGLVTCRNCSTNFMSTSSQNQYASATCPTCGLENNSKGSAEAWKPPGGTRREVACPTCTVHLEVDVPAEGSETVQCGVCSSPFLVSA